MDFSEFLGQVQHRASLDSEGSAMKATRATLETLSERLDPGEASDLGTQLPEEIGRHLTKIDSAESFEWDSFVDRLAEREGIEDRDDRADAVFHAQVVMDVVEEAVAETELQQVRDQLPEGYEELFEVADSEESPA